MATVAFQNRPTVLLCQPCDEFAHSIFDYRRARGLAVGRISESAGSTTAFPPGFERYLQAAAMGMEQNQTNIWLSMGGSATVNGNDGGWFSSVNTWS